MSSKDKQHGSFQAHTDVAADWQAILAHTPFLLSRYSSDFRYLFVSEAYARMIGRKSEDVAGKPIVEIMGEKGFNTILPHALKALQGQRAEFVSDVHFKDIGLRSLRIVYTPERNPSGEVRGWIASTLDITPEVHARRQIDEDLTAMMLLQEVAFECSRQGADFKECLRCVLDGAIAIIGADKGTFQLLDQTTGVLKIACQRGFERDFLQFFAEVRDEDCACGAAIKLGEEISVEDVQHSEIFDRGSSQRLLDAGVRSVNSIPLLQRTHSRCPLNALSPAPSSFRKGSELRQSRRSPCSGFSRTNAGGRDEGDLGS